MITPDQARALGREWFAPEVATAGQQLLEIRLLEFDAGYVVWPVWRYVSDDPAWRRDYEARFLGPVEHPSRIPQETGYPRLVVDKVTGDVSQWPALPVRLVADRYREAKLARSRFPAFALHALRHAGWFDGRDESATVGHWLRAWHQSQPRARHVLPIIPAAERFLAEFGGLRLDVYGPKGTFGCNVSIDLLPWRHPSGRLEPETLPGDMLAYFEEVAGVVGRLVFPIGTRSINPDDPQPFPCWLVIDRDSRVYALSIGLRDTIVAEDADSAISALIARGIERTF